MPNAEMIGGNAPDFSDLPELLACQFAETRQLSEALAAPLSDADATIQSMEDASPAKWHLAHTTWFFETFLLRNNVPGYRLFDAKWPFLLNSYYEAEGARIGRFARGMLSRPALDEVLAYRAHINAAMADLLDDPAHADLIGLGIAHEQQHQELLLADIKHALFQNPLGPAMFPQTGSAAAAAPEEGWMAHPGGIAWIGHEEADFSTKSAPRSNSAKRDSADKNPRSSSAKHGSADKNTGFSFDNEGPAHRVILEPFALSRRLVSNRDWDAFIADGGYREPRHWLSDGWAWVQREGVAAPLYWRGDAQFTHAGWQQRDGEAPVTHISYYEADAFASWAGARLPTEFEWEALAQNEDPAAGNQLDCAGQISPCGSASMFGSSLFGDCWQWTRSAYLPFPRFAPSAGAVGEYNGKFMSGQFVLKGASCATPRGHSRASYRNFFYPHQRWQFTGLRLAKDI